MSWWRYWLAMEQLDEVYRHPDVHEWFNFARAERSGWLMRA